MYALGVTGTYLGDYFGILMDHRVTDSHSILMITQCIMVVVYAFWQQHYGMETSRDCCCNLCVCYV